MFSEMAAQALQSVGYRTGLRDSEVLQVKQLQAEGKTAQEISALLLVEIKCIENICAYEGKTPATQPVQDYVEGEPEPEPAHKHKKR